MGALRQDLRYALRQLLGHPEFSAVALLTLSLAIGASTAVFTVVNAVLLRPLAYAESDRLVEVSSTTDFHGLSYPDLLDLRQLHEIFEDVGAYATRRFNLTGRGDPREIRVACVTLGLFNVLRLRPEVGRAFTSAEESLPVAVVSHRLWTTVFGRDPGIVGAGMVLDGRAYTVVGVLPSGIDLGGPDVDAWVPLNDVLVAEPRARSTRGMRLLEGVARLTKHASEANVRADLDLLFDRVVARETGADVADVQSAARSGRTLEGEAGFGVRPLRDTLVGAGVRRALLILLGAVALLQLIACGNIASLQLARAETRRREVAVRVALGAGRGRLVRQMLTESVLLALIAAVLGTVIARWGTGALLAIWPRALPRASEIAIDLHVWAFATALGVATGVGYGLVPAWRSSDLHVEHVLREEAPTTTTGRRRLLGALVVAQIALALVLLVSASLLIRSFVRLMSVNPGFEARGVIAARIRLSRWSYPSSQQQQQFFDQVLANLRARRSVRSVTFTTTLPFSEEWDVEWFSPGNLRPQSPLMGAIRYIVAPGFFETLGIPLRNGRKFDENDAARMPRVAIVGEALARSLWPNGDAVGRVLPLGGSSGPATIVAVVNDLKEWSLEEAEPMPQVYFPVSRAWTTPQMWLLARGGDRPLALAAAIRDAVRQADPQVPVGEIVPLEQLIGQRTAARRFSTTLMSLFAACAVVLALVGIYGLTAFAVNARAHELGIRVALGASPARVVRLLLAESALRLGMGLGIGLLLSLWATRLLSAMLFGIEPADVATYAGAALAFSAVGVAATYLPAFRATRIDPIAVLRS